MSEKVNHPRHYNEGKIEVIEFISDQRLDFWLGNAVKYICRSGRKDSSTTAEDLQKAIWYLTDKVKRLQEEDLNERGTAQNSLGKSDTV